MSFVLHSDLRDHQKALVTEEDLNKIKTSYCHRQKVSYCTARKESLANSILMKYTMFTSVCFTMMQYLISGGL